MGRVVNCLKLTNLTFKGVIFKISNTKNNLSVRKVLQIKKKNSEKTSQARDWLAQWVAVDGEVQVQFIINI